MPKKIAVVVLHGMGSASPDAKPKKGRPSYSAPLYSAVRSTIGAPVFDTNIAWAETYYSDVLDKNQNALKKRIGPQVHMGTTREFVIENLGDPASYHWVKDDPNYHIYDRVHARIDETIGVLEAAVAPGAPLVVLAFSLGCHVISNHIYDRQDLPTGGMKGMKQIAALFTFGCNIPIFTFGYAADAITAIKDPGSGLDAKFRKPLWWRNYYGEYDPLSFPMKQAGDGYAALAKSGALKDFKVNVGSPFWGLDLMAHGSNYWSNDALAAGVADRLQELISA